MKFCRHCGTPLPSETACCPKCGARPAGAPAFTEAADRNRELPPGYVRKSRSVYILLAVFLGFLGVHEFYRGEKKVGLELFGGYLLLAGALLAGLLSENVIYIFPLIALPIFHVLPFISIFKVKTDVNGFPMR